MKNTDKNQLAALLKEWFKTTNLNAKDVWNTNKVAILLKNEIEKLGHWKNAKRGNPKRAWQAMIKKLGEEAENY